jgi:transcriptional regulator with XRE-family HTH domain
MSSKSRRIAPKPAKRSSPVDSTAQMLELIGAKIRAARTVQGMTLQTLGDSTNLTVSMLSLVERGRAAPSIGSLILIANALGVAMAELVPSSAPEDQDVVVRAGSCSVVESAEGLLRTVLRNDRANGMLVSITVYRPGTGASAIPRAHGGVEHGYVLDGELTVELDGMVYRLHEGDLISYDSTRAHRIWNYSRGDAKALWFNIQSAGALNGVPATSRPQRRAKSSPRVTRG